MNKKDKHMGVNVSHELWERTHQRAIKESETTHIKIKLSDVVRRAILDYLEKHDG